MVRIDSNQKIDQKKRWIASLILMTAIVVVCLLLWHKKDQASLQTYSITQSTQDIDDVKTKQNTAAMAAREAKSVHGTVLKRPDFVSEIEWIVLQRVSSQRPESEKELTHFVNKLLFFKKQELWQSMLTSSNGSAQRHALARELLGMIPSQLNNQAIGPELAKKMESELLADLHHGNQ